jgi:uncharacterized protein YndB with AHSA1/START domain
VAEEELVRTVAAGPRQVARQVTVDAPAEELFAMLADPRRHGELDGSGTVGDALEAPERLGPDATFSVRMRRFGLPYRITSRVVAFEDGRLIQWQHPMGHTWRWEFTPDGPSRTTVTETFDYSTAKSPKMLELMKQPAGNAVGITKTLQRLHERYATRSAN